MRRTMTMILVFTMLVALPGIALAAAGDLDPLFGTGGSTSPVPDSPQDVALQSDGKIVGLGWGTLARWTSDGNLDTTFGSSGVVPGQGGTQLAVQVREDGDYLLAAQFNWEWDDWRATGGTARVSRYTPSGAVDQTFSAAVGVDGELPWPVDLEVQPDGRIVQGVTLRRLQHCFTWPAGCEPDPRDDSHMIVRYHADGGLDETFGDGGIVRLDPVLGPGDVAVQPDGRLVTANLFKGGVLVRRLETDGRLDRAFTPMAMLVPAGSPQDPAVEIDPEGNIVVAASACVTDYSDATDCQTNIRRLHHDGRVDPSFTETMISGAQVLELEIDSSGGVLVVDFQGMTRLTPSGQIDEMFGGNGSVAVANLRAAEVQPDLKIVAFHQNGPWWESNMVVSRYLGSGDATEPPPPPPPSTGTITGSVTTTSGAAIAGAVIDCGTGGSSTSSSSGEYWITEVVEGSYHCTASASGYRSKKQNVTVVADETTTANFQLHRGGGPR